MEPDGSLQYSQREFYQSLSWARLIQTTSPLSNALISILVLNSRILFGSFNGLHISVFCFLIFHNHLPSAYLCYMPF
jgi:hypothetical protein